MMLFSQLSINCSISAGGASDSVLIGQKFMARKRKVAIGCGTPRCFLWNWVIALLSVGVLPTCFGPRVCWGPWDWFDEPGCGPAEKDRFLPLVNVWALSTLRSVHVHVSACFCEWLGPLMLLTRWVVTFTSSLYSSACHAPVLAELYLRAQLRW